jgi:DNA-binding NarL/FixJ family response regulator
MIKIVIIDDRKQDRELIYSILSTQKGFEISGSGKDGYDALKLATEHRPHIIIMDLRDDDIGGPDLVPLIKRKSPTTAVIFLSGYDDDVYAGKALSSGASGYLVKKTDMDKLADSVRTVHSGGYFINTPICIRIFGRFSKEAKHQKFYPAAGQEKKPRQRPIPSTINQTELDIMALIGKGHTNKEVAAKLNLKPGTVRNYLSSAMHKAGLKSRTQVAIFAIKHGLTETVEI